MAIRGGGLVPITLTEGPMEQTTGTAHIEVVPRDVQARGSFDGGRITECKPVCFPHEAGRQKRIGPLFYWALATASGKGRIGLHPHQGFEILSYVLEGELGHYDTLGHRSRVGKGGVQVMQTGSGVSHEEETLGDHTVFFQIWFEPALREALGRAPTYSDHHHEDFPKRAEDGVTVKTILGEDSPIELVVDAGFADVHINSVGCYRRRLSAGRTLAVLAIAGGGMLTGAGAGTIPLQSGDLAVVCAGEDGMLEARPEASWRLAIIEVPTEVSYPLYPKM